MKGISPTNIKVELDSSLGESIPSFTTITYSETESNRGRTSCQDEHRSGRPNEVITLEYILDALGLNVRKLADMIVVISKSDVTDVHRILPELL